MTASSRTIICRAAVLLAIAASSSVFAANPALAYTMEAQQMCTGDAFRLCSTEIPNIPKITACMIKHRADLSAGCRAVMDRESAQKSHTVAQR